MRSRHWGTGARVGQGGDPDAGEATATHHTGIRSVGVTRMLGRRLGHATGGRGCLGRGLGEATGKHHGRVRGAGWARG